jgi:hypothetical protein
LPVGQPHLAPAHIPPRAPGLAFAQVASLLLLAYYAYNPASIVFAITVEEIKGLSLGVKVILASKQSRKH